jgi:hypothetical protein
MFDLDDPADTDAALDREWAWPSGTVECLSELARRHVNSRDSGDAFSRAALLELVVRGVPLNIDTAARVRTILDFERERLRRAAAARRASVARYLA